MKYRQGDVVIKKVDSVKGEKRQDLILAYGEVTGHRHEVIGKAETYIKDGVLYLKAEEEVTLYHGNTSQIDRQVKGEVLNYQTEDVHGPITLPAGDYEIRIQREYEPEGWRYVAD